LKKKKSLR